MGKFGQKLSLMACSYLNAIQNFEGPLSTPELKYAFKIKKVPKNPKLQGSFSWRSKNDSVMASTSQDGWRSEGTSGDNF